MAELLGGDLGMAWITKVARVLVHVLTTQGERLLMIDHGGKPNGVPV